MPAASVVLSLLTLFRPVKKASRLSVREPTVLPGVFMKRYDQDRRVPARQPDSFSLESRKENEPKETAHLQWASPSHIGLPFIAAK